MTGSALDKVNGRTKEASGSSYADFWMPHKDNGDDGTQLTGIVVKIHESQYDADSPIHPVLTVMSVGEPSDYDAGVKRATPTHSRLVGEVKNAEVGDLVNIKFMGREPSKKGNSLVCTYEVGLLRKEEWAEMDEAEEFESLVDANGGYGPDERGQLQAQQSDEEESPQTTSALDSVGAQTDGGTTAVQANPEARDVVQNAVNMQNGEISLDMLERLLAGRGIDADAEAEAIALGFTVEDGTVTN